MIETDSDVIPFDSSQRALAEPYGVTPDIHREDHIFRYMATLQNNDLSATLATYLVSGRASVEKIRDHYTDLAGVPAHEGRIEAPLAIMDFASGFGCVARHLRNMFPNASVSAVDIHEKACRFNEDRLKVEGVLSSADPAKLPMSRRFDLIVSLSFFSHMPRRAIAPWLRTLSGFLNPGSLFLFTTHGVVTHEHHLADLAVDRRGYAFAAYSEQLDLSTKAYGQAVTYPNFITQALAGIPEVDLVLFRQGAWWGHQDVYVLRRRSTPLPRRAGAFAPMLRAAKGLFGRRS